MRTKLAGIGAAAVVALAGTAMGQNALGDGRGLERNLQRGGAVQPAGGQGTYQRPNFQDEVRLRNAVVTGNIGGGKALRTSVGYVEQDDFRVRLPSEELFRFRRDSFSAASLGLRGTEGLQYQYAYTSGNVIFNRGGDAATGAAVTAAFTSDAFARSRFGTMMRGSTEAASRIGTLRSTGAFASTRMYTPSLVGTEVSGLTANVVTASGLLGLRKDLAEESVGASPGSRRPNTPPPANAVDPGVTLELEPNMLEQVRSRLDTSVPSHAVPPPTLPGAQPEKPTTEPGARPTEPATRPGVEPPPARPDKPGAVQPDPGTTGTREPATGKPGFTGTLPTTPTPTIPPTRGGATQPGTTQPGTPGAGTGRSRVWESQLDQLRRKLIVGERRLNTNDPEPAPEADLAEAELIRAIREAGGNVNRLATGKARPGDLYTESIQAGSTFIGTGRYFDAEERFARALAMRPGDVTAMVGRVHAQMGAGLVMSAAMNLRILYEQHPEVIGVRYGGEAIPPGERLATLVEELRANVVEARRKRWEPPAESALVMAYIGFQTGVPGVTREGLELLKEAEGPNPTVLRTVLERVWLGAQAVPPVPTPPSPAPIVPPDPSK